VSHGWVIFFAVLAGVEAFVDAVLTLIVVFTVRSSWFWLIQFVNWHLVVIGWFVCLSPRLAKALWIFWNDDDGAVGATYWARYRWLAWRNPVDNLKHLKLAQAPGPLAYRTWIWRGRQYYYKVGWMSDTYPAMSIGAGRGY
jgi:hypothetical protein